jgi:hypothetical protein
MLLACGGGDNTADGGLDAAVDTTTSDTGGSDTGNAESGSESGVEAGPPSCKSSDAGCATCCFTRYADAAAYFFQTEMGCACNVPGDCSTICQNDLCMGAKAGTACALCLRDKDAGDCLTTSVLVCSGDPTCAPFLTCIGGCPVVIPPDGGTDASALDAGDAD